jgi:hypothetical protein
MEASGQLHAPSYLFAGKSLLFPLGGPQRLSAYSCVDKDPRLRQESNPDFPNVQCVHSHHSDWATQLMITIKYIMISFYILVRGQENDFAN